MTDLAARINALHHTGTDASPLGESAEYVLKLVVPAIIEMTNQITFYQKAVDSLVLLIQSKVDPTELGVVLDTIIGNKASAEEMATLFAGVNARIAKLETATGNMAAFVDSEAAPSVPYTATFAADIA